MHNIVLLVLLGGLVGTASTSPARGARREGGAARARAAAERERLARAVHDGVLQTLAYIHRRGDEIGGEAAELSVHGRRAGAIAAPLRLGHRRPDVADAADLRGVEGARSTCGCCSPRASAPTSRVVGARPTRCCSTAPVADEVDAAVEAALDNVRRHAGAGARAWVLLEDDRRRRGDRARRRRRRRAGRLLGAAERGRLGVASRSGAGSRTSAARSTWTTRPGGGASCG